ncbi:MAG: C2H2-type zinc finger protein, partial [Candidatus Aenigmatarchaeota archaeon]
SGGSIWIITTNISGSGTIASNGREGGPSSSGGGGSGGRIAIYATNNSFSGPIITYGLNATWVAKAGSAGTVYIKLSSRTHGDLIINNNNTIAGNRGGIGAGLYQGVHTFDNINISGKGTLEITNTSIELNLTGTNITSDRDFFSSINVLGNLTVTSNFSIANWTLSINGSAIIKNLENLTIDAGGTLTHPPNYEAQIYWMDLSLYKLTILAGGALNVSGSGFYGSAGPGRGNTTDWCGGGGGGYGGFGGNGASKGGNPYGTFLEPTDVGSGGGQNYHWSQTGGPGGGAIKVNASIIEVQGQILAEGETNPANAIWNSRIGGGGSGGSIWLITNNLTGGGNISAKGGNGFDGTGCTDGGGGSGGRAHINAKNITFSGMFSVKYGIGPGAAKNGTNGTFVLEFSDIINVSSATFASPVMIARNNSFGRIVFTNPNQTLDTSIDFQNAVNITSNFVSVASESNADLNNSAMIWLIGAPILNDPTIVRNGQNCTASICTWNDAVGPDYSFNVTQFSNYSVGDVVLPIVNITFPNGSLTYRETNISLNFSVDEINLDQCFYSLNGNVNISINDCVNTTINATDVLWNNITVYANDTMGNVGYNNVTFWVQTNLEPNITEPTLLPLTAYTNDTLNATIGYLDPDAGPENGTVFFRWFVNGTLVYSENVTDIANNTNASVTLSGDNFSRFDNVTVEVYAYDGASYSRYLNASVNISNFIARAPTLTAPLNNTLRAIANASLVWENTTSLDIDNDTITYVVQIANDSTFSTFIFNGSTTAVSYTNYSLPDANVYWRIRSFDQQNYSAWSEYYMLKIIRATLNITSPSNNLTIYPGASYNIITGETNRTDWVTNVTVQVMNDGLNQTYAPTNDTDVWTYLYTVPESLSPRLLTVVARGFNGTNSSQGFVNTSIQLRLTRPVGVAIGPPNITVFYPHPTNVVPNDTVNITMRIDMDTIYSYISINFTLPNGTSMPLFPNVSVDDNVDFVYERNYMHNATINGTYTLTVSAADINDQLTQRTITFYARDAVLINLSAVGGEEIKLIDMNSEFQFINGTNITATMPPGYYDVEIRTDTPVIKFNAANITNDTLVVLEYNNTAENIAPPSRRRSVDQFRINTSLSYTDFDINYNYSGLINTLSDEDNLELYKCNQTGTCSWEEHTIFIYTGQDKFNITLDRMSYFLLAEAAADVPVTQTVYGQGVSRVVSRSVVEDMQLDIIVPALIAMSSNDDTKAPVILHNRAANSTMYNLTISASTDSDDLSFEFSRVKWDQLPRGARTNTTMYIYSHTEPRRYNVTILVEVERPKLNRTALMIIDLSPYGGEQASMYDNLIFARNLFAENPECYELSELLNEADLAISKNETGKAASMIDSAIQACRDLLRSLGKEMKIPLSKIDWMIVAGIAAIVSFAVFVAAYLRTKSGKKSSKPEQHILCKKCGKYFASQESLKTHMKHAHSS